MHAEILNAFPDPPTGDRRGEARILWRLDDEGRHTFLYVTSPDAPDLNKLTEEAGWETAPGAVKPYGDFIRRLRVGSRWGFRLTANPVRYTKRPGDRRGRRSPHVTVGYQEEWLQEKARQHGFDLTEGDGHSFILTKRRTLQFTRSDSTNRVTIATAQFDGELRVSDAEALRAALRGGIGPAKAYGCGMLTLAPIRK